MYISYLQVCEAQLLPKKTCNAPHIYKSAIKVEKVTKNWPTVRSKLRDSDDFILTLNRHLRSQDVSNYSRNSNGYFSIYAFSRNVIQVCFNA